MGGIRIEAFGADRIGLPVEFLNEKIELLADRILILQHRGHLANMAFEPYSLLVDSYSVREYGNLLKDPVLVVFPVLKNGRDLLLKAFLIFVNCLGGIILDNAYVTGND